MIPIQVWRYWEGKEHKDLTGYYDGFFNLDNKIVLVAAGAGDKYEDEYGTQVQGDVFITFKCADDTVTDIGVDTESWNRISKYYEFQP